MIKKLDYIDRVDYDKLPQSFKDNRKKLTELGKQLRKLEKDKTKYQSKLTSIKTDLKDLTKQYNKLYNELKPININYSPKCYCTEYTKGDNPTKYLNLVIKLKDTTMSWTIDINSDDDIFNLFGKAGKFPAQVATTPPVGGTVVDEGEIELGVQRTGYHEYFLKGNKFETKLHVRVVPVDDKEMWLAWTGYKQTPADREGDEGLWNINEDKYSKLVINTENE